MDRIQLFRALMTAMGTMPNGGGASPMPMPAAQQAPTLPGAGAGLARQPVGAPGCGSFQVDGSPVFTGPVRNCQQDIATGCSGGGALRQATLTAGAPTFTIAIEPSQMLYLTKLTLFVRRTAGVLAGTGVNVEVEYDGQTVFPRHLPKEIDSDAFTTEAQRAGLNPLPGNMPLFTRDRPMNIIYTATGPAIPANESIIIGGVATLASPSDAQMMAQFFSGAA
jgi:hypothetical protein